MLTQSNTFVNCLDCSINAIFGRQRKEVVNQLRHIEDEDWQVFNTDMLDEDNTMEIQATHKKTSKVNELYKNQVCYLHLMTVWESCCA